MVSVSSVFPVNVSPAGKPLSLARGLPVTVDVPGTFEEATVGDVKLALAEKFPKLYKDRQKLTLPNDKKTLTDESTLKDAGLKEDEAEVWVKDLGPQISWRTVFLVEYAGPLVIHPLIYHFPKVFFLQAVRHSTLQKYLYAMVLLHFLKREFETVFVHRFSHATMPARNIFKNSAHYHILSGVLLAYALYGPSYSANSPAVRGTYRSNTTALWAGVAVWAFAELSNLITHINLRNLRPKGTKTRAIPRGYGFDLVTCPNYTFEILAWTAVAAMSGSWAAWLFVGVSGYQMTVWAIKKHKQYRKEFGNAYPRRKVIFPFIF